MEENENNENWEKLMDEVYDAEAKLNKKNHKEFLKALKFYKKHINFSLKNDDFEDSILNDTNEEGGRYSHIGYCNVEKVIKNGRTFYKLIDDDRQKYNINVYFERQENKDCGYHELVWQTAGYSGDDYEGYILFPMNDGRYWIVEFRLF